MSKAMELAKAFGYLYPNEVVLLKAVANLIPTGSLCANIGAGSGTSSLAVIEQRPDLSRTFITIDISKGGAYGGLENERNAFLNAFLIDHLPNQVLGDSTQVWKQFDGKEFGYVFIDGNHEESGIRGDILGWRHLVKPGGYMAFHDYGSNNWPAVKQVVNEMMSRDHLLAIADTLAVFEVT